MILTEQQKVCDHHFGEQGELDNCSKCGLDRHVARVAGKVKHKQAVHDARAKLNS